MSSLAAIVSLLASAATVDAPAGRFSGAIEGETAVYRGIPYAQPPVGPLRWRAPRPLPRFPRPFAATRFGATCMQADPKGDAGTGVEPPSEDCLTLNIWAPPGAGRRPVMVWLHGGGYTGGSGSAALYDGSGFARRGAVVVTLNYRLGRFGFFAHPELSATGEGPNFGLLDQRAALTWLRDNIAAFGGDPKRVTLFGNSAGGESILFHMTAQGSDGLFHRAIVQSGLGGRTLRRADASVDADRAATPIADLRKLSAAAILAWGSPSLYRGFGPMIDGVTIRENIGTAFRARRQARIPLIIGYNSDELPTAVMGTAPALAMVGDDAARRAAGIAAYGSVGAYERNIASDTLFRAPALRLARHHAQAGLPVWSYEFDVVPTAVAARLTGAPHASERAYVFETLPRLGWPTDATDNRIAADIADRWARFARGGLVLPGWKRSQSGDARPKVFSRRTDATPRPFNSALAAYHGF